MTVIKKIKEAAKNSNSSLLKEEVYLNTELNLYDFIDNEKLLQVYVDVPLGNIVSLGRQDFWREGETWIDVVQHLHGNEWSDEVFKYFESELKEKDFPAPSSMYQLRLTCYGGICKCGNGNHRLVAAKAWLIASYGDKASLKKAKVSYYPLKHEIKEVFKILSKKGSSVLISSVEFNEQLEFPDTTYFFISKSYPEKVYALKNNKVIEIKQKKSFYKKMISHWQEPWHEKREWKEIPHQTIIKMLDDEWFNNYEYQDD